MTQRLLAEQPVEQMAAAATRALVHRQVAPYWQRVFPAPLQVRRSSGNSVVGRPGQR